MADNGESDLVGVDPADEAQGQRTVEALTTHLVFDYGLSVLPVAGPPGTPPRVARRHAGVCYKVIKWAYQRLRDRPNLPSVDTGDSADTLLSKSLSVAMPGVGAGDEKLWSRCGVYTYLRSDMPAESEPVTVSGNPMYGKDDVDNNDLLPTEFVTWLLQSPTVSQLQSGDVPLPPGVVQES